MSGHWNVDSIGDALDGSLSGLGIELGTGSFNMSDTLMALPTLNSLNQEKEARSDPHNTNGSSEANNQCNEIVVQPSPMVLQGKKNRLSLGNYGDCSLTTKRFCVSTEREATDTSQASRYNYSSSIPDLHVSSITHEFQLSSDSVVSFHCQNISTQENNSSVAPPGFHSAEFQYILGAATALGTRKHDETMTYLNQGQSYEIKLKMLGDLTEMRGRLIKSLLKVGFQERKLQFAEKEQITQWQQAHPSERILEIDIPLSYGVYEARNDPQSVNKCEFLWDPTKETGVFIKMNCISTEFTPKKHGGEKGVPFYIQVESYNHGDVVDKLHVASCQVKVFKPKGADRKHKTDKERMVKKTQSEQEKFRPSYDCTVLTESSAETLCSSSLPAHVFNLSSASLSIASSVKTSQKTSSPDLSSAFKPIKQIHSSPSPVTDVMSTPRVYPLTTSCPLSLDATVSEVSQWLKQNRLSQYINTFTDYCGSDLLRLTRNDIIQICGFADGIRLFSTLQSRRIPPCLTLYVCPSSEKVFRAIFLDTLTVSDLVVQLSTVFDLSLHNQVTLCCSGPSDIKVLLTDEVIQNMNDEAMFTLELITDQFDDVCQVILKPCSP